MNSKDFLNEDYKSDFDHMINKMINDIWNQEAQRRVAKQPRYLVYSQNTGTEMDTNNLEDALFAAQVISKRDLDAPSLVYDRVTKFPVVAYQGSEDMWYKTNTNSPKLHEAHPKQQLSLYNPSGTTYRHEKMPTLQKDPVDKARKLSKNIPAELPDPDEEIRQQQLKKKLDSLLQSELTPREKKVLTSYYYDGKTLEKIAQEIGFSTARARQIVMKAERKLRHPARASQLEPFLINEYGEVPGQRKIEFNKENPPPFDHLYQQFIQTMLAPNNTVEPQVWIDNVNKLYGLNYKYKDYQNRGHKDYTNNWDKVVKRYILNKA